MNTLLLSQLPAESRAEINAWDAAFTSITGPVTRAFPVIAGQFGVSVATAMRKYYAWRERGLAGLVNGSHHPAVAAALRCEDTLHPDTIEYYRQLCFENGRKCRPAYRALVRAFFKGEAIPGLPPGTPRLKLPAGWTSSNFSRHNPTKFELKAARQGLRAAAEFRPLVYTTRREMYFFQELQFDDVWHDAEAVLLGRNQRVRPLQLGALEVLSACLFEWCIKPRIRRDDDTRTNLGPNDHLFLLAAIFGKYGHNPRGTRMNFESGTAVPPAEAIDLIHKLSGGEVVCRIGKTSCETAFLGQYPGSSKGNFRTRAMLESLWNLTHNESGNRLTFPGQFGSNSRTNAPEDLHGRGREQDLILRAMPALPAWVIENLRMPLPEWHQALRAINELNEGMNQRGLLPGTEHAIEGFVEAGLVTTDFDFPGWGLISRADFEQRLAQCDPQQQLAIRAMVNGVPRKLSPREVFNLGVRGQLSTLNPQPSTLTKWRPEALAQLLYPARRDGVVRVGKDHLVTFDDQDISPEPLRFLAHHFSPGDEFECVCNPMVPDLLFIYDAAPARRGAWLGVLKSWGRVSRADSAAVGERIGQAEKVKRQLLTPVVQAGDRLTRQRLEMLENNNQVLQQHAAEQSAAEDDLDNALSRSLE